MLSWQCAPPRGTPTPRCACCGEARLGRAGLSACSAEVGAPCLRAALKLAPTDIPTPPPLRHATSGLGLEPDEIMLHCLVECLGRAGRWADALHWFVEAHLRFGANAAVLTLDLSDPEACGGGARLQKLLAAAAARCMCARSAPAAPGSPCCRRSCPSPCSRSGPALSDRPGGGHRAARLAAVSQAQRAGGGAAAAGRPVHHHHGCAPAGAGLQGSMPAWNCTLHAPASAPLGASQPVHRRTSPCPLQAAAATAPTEWRGCGPRWPAFCEKSWGRRCRWPTAPF